MGESTVIQVRLCNSLASSASSCLNRLYLYSSFYVHVFMTLLFELCFIYICGIS